MLEENSNNTDSSLWKLNDHQKWQLFSHADVPLDPIVVAAQTGQINHSNNKQDSAPTASTGKQQQQKPSTQVFYLPKPKQEVKGSLVYTPSGYGIIHNITSDSDSITVKVNGEMMEFDRSNVMSEIPIEFTHVQDGGRKKEKMSFSVQSTAKDIIEKLRNDVEESQEKGQRCSECTTEAKRYSEKNESLEKLGIVADSKLLVLATRGKLYSVSRYNQVFNGWSYGNGTYEGISFTISNNCQIAGVGMYSVYTENTPPVSGTIKLVEGSSKNGAVLAEAEMSLSKNENPNDKTQKTMFERPISIKAGGSWSIVVETKTQGFGFGARSNTYYGNGGVAKAEGGGGISFEFQNCSGGSSQTNIMSGQIPEIYYYA